MDLTVYTENAPGQLLKQGTGDAAYHAFVPNPLPPDLEFDVGLANALAEASSALGELGGLARALPNPYLFIRPFIRREAVASSRIEGTEANLSDLYIYEADQGVMSSLRPPAMASDVREVYNYVLALNYGLSRLSDLPLSSRLIREMHELLMGGVRGERETPGQFRRSQNWIGPAGCLLNEATFVPPPADEMQRALADLEQYLHSEEEPHHSLVRLAFIHYQFEAIHPFIDGNGRVGRLLLAVLAVHWGLVAQPLLYLSPYFERHRDRYYELLMGVSTRGAWREWVEFFLTAVTEESADAVRRTKALQDLQAEWRERVTTKRASANLLRLLDGLFESPVLSIPQAQELMGMTYRGAQLNVDKLVGHGILRQIGEASYGRLFIAEGIFAVLGAREDEVK